jgi:hypothetical protein
MDASRMSRAIRIRRRHRLGSSLRRRAFARRIARALHESRRILAGLMGGAGIRRTASG